MYFDFHLFICMITAMKKHLQFVMFFGMEFLLAATAKGVEYLANVMYLTRYFSLKHKERFDDNKPNCF